MILKTDGVSVSANTVFIWTLHSSSFSANVSGVFNVFPVTAKVRVRSLTQSRLLDAF